MLPAVFIMKKHLSFSSFFLQINLPSVFFAVENCVTPSLVVLMYGTTVQRYNGYNGTMVQWYTWVNENVSGRIQDGTASCDLFG